MKKASEYRAHAGECRMLARTALTPEHKAMLENMAHTWEMLAEEREQRLLREQRIAELERAAGALEVDSLLSRQEPPQR